MQNVSESWLVLAYGAGLFFLLLNPSKATQANAFRRAFQFYSLSLSCILADLF